MQSLRPDLKREGIVVSNNRELAELAGPRWAALSLEEREPFNEQAKREKQNRKYGPQPDKMDCTGQYISQRVDTVQLNEQRRRKERKLVVESWTGKDVCNERFLMIGFMSLCDMPDDKFMPCEMAIAEYSLRNGIIRNFHKYIDPGTIPLGYRYEAMRQSEATHQIPPEGLSTETYQQIYEDVLRFVNPRKLASYPPVYCKASETKLTENSLDWLASRAGSSNKIKKVYELEGLICDLFAESRDAESKVAPSKHHATELLSTTVFDYEAGARCKWHEEREIRFCASSTVKRYCYCLSDFLCDAFGIERTSSHLPERPDVDSCTVITPRIGKSNSEPSGGRSQGRKQNDTDMDYRGNRNNNPYQPGERKKQYARRGPTYDEESLRSTEVVPPSSSNAQNTFSTGLPAFGRGRGRGRAAIPTQPLRRPAMPGRAGAGGEKQIESEPVVNQDVSPWSGSFGAGRGRGMRLPNTAPMGWAGPASAPDPSAAPLPPTAWQHVGGLPTAGSNTAWKEPNINIGGMPCAAWPSLGSSQSRLQMDVSSNQPNTNLNNDFQTFSLYDRDEYDY